MTPSDNAPRVAVPPPKPKAKPVHGRAARRARSGKRTSKPKAKPVMVAGTWNAVGLTDQGKALLSHMRSFGAILDVAHLSRRAIRQLGQWLEVTEGAASNPVTGPRLPLIHSHCTPDQLLPEKARKFYGEFSCDDTTFNLVTARGGMVAIHAGVNDVLPYKKLAATDPKEVPNTCAGSSASLAQLVHHALQRAKFVGLSTSLNGLALQTGPRFGKQACPNPARVPAKFRSEARKQEAAAQNATTRLGTPFDELGLATIAQFPDLVDDLGRLGTDVSTIRNSAELFLRVWERGFGVDSRQAPLFRGGHVESMICQRYRAADANNSIST